MARRYLMVLINDPNLKIFEPVQQVVKELFDQTTRETSIAIRRAKQADLVRTISMSLAPFAADSEHSTHFVRSI